MAIGTAVNVFVQVSVETLSSPAASDEAGFAHVVEASLKSEAGRLVVKGCTDYERDAARFGVAPGWLRLRASRSNLDTAAALDIDSAKTPETLERGTDPGLARSSCGCHGRQAMERGTRPRLSLSHDGPTEP